MGLLDRLFKGGGYHLKGYFDEDASETIEVKGQELFSGKLSDKSYEDGYGYIWTHKYLFQLIKTDSGRYVLHRRLTTKLPRDGSRAIYCSKWNTYHEVPYYKTYVAETEEELFEQMDRERALACSSHKDTLNLFMKMAESFGARAAYETWHEGRYPSQPEKVKRKVVID